MTRLATRREIRPAAAAVRAPTRAGGANVDPLRVLRRHKLALLISGFLGGILGAGAFLVLRQYAPLYTGQVLFEITAGIQEAQDIGVGDITSEDIVTRIATTETYVLTGREVLSDAVSSLEIEETEWHKQFLKPDGSWDRDAAVDDLVENVRAKPLRGTNLFAVTWTASVAADVPTVLNNIERAYTSRSKARHQSVYNDNIQLFRGQLDQSNRDLENLNEEISLYIQDKGLTNLNDLRFSSLQVSLDHIAAQLQTEMSAYTSAQTRFQQIANKLQGAVEPTAEDELAAKNHPDVRMLEQEIIILNRELRIASEKFNETHRDIGSLTKRLAATIEERDLLLEQKIRAALDAQLKVMGDEQERLRKSIEALEAEGKQKQEELQKLAADYSKYEAMNNRRSHLEEARDELLGLISQVRMMRLRADAARVHTAQKALLPREMSFPKPEVIIPLGAVLCLGLTLGVIFLRELTDQRVKSASDLLVLPGANVLGVIPELEEDPTRVEAAELAVRRSPNSIIAEAYRQTSAAICRAMDRTGSQTLVLLSGLPGAGSTTIATNLAAAASAAGKRVLLVDANFRRPRLLEALGLSNDRPGLGDLLAGAATLESVIVHDDSSVDILPAGTPANRIFEQLSNSRFDNLIGELRATYDLIVFDAPPAVVAGDSIVLANKVDAAVLVVRANQEQRGLVSRLIHQITDARSELIGLVLNRPRGTAGGYFKKNYAAMAEYSVQES